MKRVFSLLLGLIFTFSLAQAQKFLPIKYPSHWTVKAHKTSPWAFRNTTWYYLTTTNISQYSEFSGSPAWIKISYDEYSYNDQYKWINTLTYQLDTVTVTYIPVDQDTIIRNERQLIVEVIRKVLDTNTNQLINNERYTSDYDELDNLIARTYYQWDTIGDQWANVRLDSFYYQDTLLIRRVALYWEDDSNAWVYNWRVDFSYDSVGNIVEDIFYNWLDTAWTILNKTLYLYDSTGLLQEVQIQIYDSYNDEWLTVYKVEFTYDDNNNLIQTLSYVYTWTGSGFEWVYDYKEVMAYNEANLLIKDTTSFWETDHWVYEDNYYYEYDDNGNMTLNMYQSWDEDSGAWINEERYTIEYDLDVPVVHAIYPDDFLSDMQLYNIPVSAIEYQWSDSLNEWVNYMKYDLIYGQFETPVNDVNNSVLVIYPNPVEDYINLPADLNIYRITIIDLNGRQLKRIKVDSPRIKVSDLPAGSYIMVAYTADGIKTAQFIKK